MILLGGEPTPLVQALEKERYDSIKSLVNSRPKSWSICNEADQPNQLKSIAVSLDNVTQKKNIVLPCKNGKVYSVSQNRIVYLEGKNEKEVSKVRNIVCEFEAQKKSAASKLMWDPGPKINFNDISEYNLQNENWNHQNDLIIQNMEENNVMHKLENYFTQNSWRGFNGIVDDNLYTILYNTWDSENIFYSDMCFGSCNKTLCSKNAKCKRFKLEVDYRDKFTPVDINIICPKPYQNRFCDIQHLKETYKVSNTTSEMFYTSVMKDNISLQPHNFSSISVSLINNRPFGIVKNLKLEYESKTIKDNFNKKSFNETNDRTISDTKAEDLSVKYLVGRYENTTQDNSIHHTVCKNKPNIRKIHSAPAFTCSTNLIDLSFSSLPIIKKNQTKNKLQFLQYGKPHCLSRLILNRSNSNFTMCNTMLYLH